MLPNSVIVFNYLGIYECPDFVKKYRQHANVQTRMQFAEIL